MTGTENGKTEKLTGALHGKNSYLRNRNREYLRNRISKRSRKTVRPPALLVEKTVLMLKSHLKNVIQDAIAYASEDKRGSISALDVSKALKKQDFTRCDKSFSSDTGDKENSVDQDA